ncbi:TPA: hypothetical protein HA278_05075 [Candidatus Woesearchaeota archaeon]|nr:hypothetical protein [Candidatus Woesearchaeota archaeon]
MALKLLLFGDSITFGKGVPSGRGWSTLLREYAEPQDPYNYIYNLGIPGDTSTHLLERFSTEANARYKTNRPENTYAIVIAIGINDTRALVQGEPETSFAQFTGNIQTLISQAQDITEHLFFIGLTRVDETLTQPWEDTYFDNETIEKYEKEIQRLCQEHSVPFLDVEWEKENYKELLADGLHPNEKGYQFIFEKVKKFLEDNEIIQ